MDWKDGFAKDQLEKYGWVEGSGLGKSEHGITEAIKVKIKNDTRGVGHDAAEEFTFHWWDHVFNKAANSIKVKTSEEGVLVQKESDSGKISSSKAGMKTFDNKQMLYGRFIKSATLMNTGQTIEEEKSESSSESEDETKAMRCVDDIMFKKCGGRTAHKGARHGLGLSGKLARIEEQERLLSEAVKTEGQRSPYGLEENREHKKKLKKSKKSKQDKSEIVTSCDASEETQKEKKSKKRQSHMADSDDLSNEQEEIPKKKSKKKKDHENSDDIKCETSENGKLSGALHSKGKPKKSKKRSVENDPDMLHVSINDLSNSGNLKTNGSLKKISKKKKLSDADVDSELQERVDVSVDFGSVDAPKKSKKKKKRNVEKCLEQQDKHGVEINDDSCEQTENGEENEEFHENVKSERKKKKKKRKQQENE